MARVRMLMDVSGLRGGTEEALGVPWPQHGEILETGDEEAAALVRNGMAEPVAEPRTRPAPTADAGAQEPAKPSPARTAPRAGK